MCDPVIEQSVVLFAENSVGVDETGDPNIDDEKGCNGIKQTKMRGIIECAGVIELEFQDFAPFGVKCKPNVKGHFLDAYLYGLR